MDENAIRAKFHGDETVRIVFDMNTKSLNPDNFLGAADEIISLFAPDWKSNPRTRLVLIEATARHTYIAVDRNNDRYRFETAHRDFTALPVWAVRRASSRAWFMTREPQYDAFAAKRIADQHNVSGYLYRPPFVADHLKGRQYYVAPRDLNWTWFAGPW